MTDQKQMNTVDSMLPIPQLFAFGLQHVLAMYAGAVAVPIIVAQAMNLPMEDLIRLITADLFTCGIATLIQTLGFGKIGGRIPMIPRCYLCFCWTYGHDWCSAWYDCYLWCYYRSRFIYLLDSSIL